MSPLDRLALVSCFIMAVAALGIAIYAVYLANGVRTTLEEQRSAQVQRDRRLRDLGPPQGVVDRRRHAHPDPTVRARRRDRDDPQFEQRPQERRGAHRHPDEPATTELDAQPADGGTTLIEAQLPRPGAIRREQ